MTLNYELFCLCFLGSGHFLNKEKLQFLFLITAANRSQSRYLFGPNKLTKTISEHTCKAAFLLQLRTNIIFCTVNPFLQEKGQKKKKPGSILIFFYSDLIRIVETGSKRSIYLSSAYLNFFLVDRCRGKVTRRKEKKMECFWQDLWNCRNQANKERVRNFFFRSKCQCELSLWKQKWVGCFWQGQYHFPIHDLN